MMQGKNHDLNSMIMKIELLKLVLIFMGTILNVNIIERR